MSRVTVGVVYFWASLVAFATIGVLVAVGPVVADPYFNSSEPGCDGSDPNVLLCEDFESGTWYDKNCGQTGIPTASNPMPWPGAKGWCGTIYNDAGMAAGTARCGGVGVLSACAGTTGVFSGTTGNMADHALLNFQGVNDIWVRFYTKPLAGYGFGAEKMLTFNDGGPGDGGIRFGNLSWNCAQGGASATGNITMGFPVPMDVCQSQNQGNNITIQSGNWYFYEVHYKLSDPGQSNGVFELWVNDCGPTVTTSSCGSAPILRLRRTDVNNARTSSNQLIRVLWFEAWANPVSSGERYLDQIKVSKTGPIGFIGTAGPPASAAVPGPPTAITIK
jgi:hypothetical protein